MSVTKSSRHLLYLLTAFVLLLQSFAVWHDATHPFHVATEQCHRLDAINHLPGLDSLPIVEIPIHSSVLVTAAAAAVPLWSQRYKTHHPIRAPPVVS